MGVLRTVVATAVIVFALTTVAMAGVQHFTKHDRQTAIQAAKPSHTITLTDKQLAKLLAAGRQVATPAPKSEHRQVQEQTRATQRVYTNARTTDRASQASSSGIRGGYRCWDTTHSNCEGHSGYSGSHSGGGGCCW